MESTMSPSGISPTMTTVQNSTGSLRPSEIPREIRFNDDSLFSVVAYSILFLIAALGNTTVFVTLFRNRHRKSRVNLFIMHLAVADLLVTFIMMPTEIGWHVTVAWKAGGFGCRFFMFFRTFGFYLSSFILIAISLDRLIAIKHPMSLSDAGRRGRIMLLLAWLLSAVASIPQSVIFHVESHPKYPWFKQCVTYNFYPTPSHEMVYNVFNIITVYGLPLVVIIVSYTLILCEISKKTRESKAQTFIPGAQDYMNYMRRSGMGRIEKARTRTLKMTIVIVLVFIMCWTPYFVILVWYWLDRDSASKVDMKIQRGLFIFAVSNSCMNPIVYGMFSIRLAQEFRRCCPRLFKASYGQACNPYVDGHSGSTYRPEIMTRDLKKCHMAMQDIARGERCSGRSPANQGIRDNFGYKYLVQTTQDDVKHVPSSNGIGKMFKADVT